MLKRKIKSKPYIIILILDFLVFFNISNAYLYDNGDLDNDVNSPFVKNNYITSGPIRLDNAQDWIDLKNEGKCTGYGTSGSPYIINDLEINGQGSNCIMIISNDNIYYKITNCWLYNGNFGILMTNDIGDVINNVISSNSDSGINLNPYSTITHYIEISGNTISNNGDDGIDGIWLENILISNNDILNNQGDGIYINGGPDQVDAINNVILNNEGCGIYYVSPNDCEIRGNTVNYNEGGIYFSGPATNNLFTGNSINYNVDYTSDFGIKLRGGGSNIIEYSTITDNSGPEIHLDSCDNNIIRYNTIIGDVYWGGSTGNTLIDNIHYWYDDRYEYNDFDYDAAEISIDSYENLRAYDDDWYRIDLNQGDEYNISILSSLLNESLNLYIYDSSGTLLDYSNSGSYVKYIMFTASSTDYYYIKISDGINDDYDLNIDLYLGPPPGSFDLFSDAENPIDTDGNFILSWAESNDAEDYSVFIGQFKYGSWDRSEYSAGIDSLSCPITGLEDGQYYFEVIAYNSVTDKLSNNRIYIEVGITSDGTGNTGNPGNAINGFDMLILIGFSCIVSFLIVKRKYKK